MDLIEEMNILIAETVPNSQLSIDSSAMVEQWKTAKQPIIDLFGGQTRLVYPKADYSLSVEEKENNFKHFCATVIPFASASFEDFLTANEDGFYNNKVVEPYPCYSIKKGMKLSKCFKYFFDNEDVLRLVQDYASKFMQMSKIEGELVLSVDPRDFFFLSDNNENWTNCHSIGHDRCLGNLNYMVDNSTIIAYLCNGEKQLIGNYSIPWYSKKWRMLMHFSDCQNALLYSRQYPYENKLIIEKLNDFLPQLGPPRTCTTNQVLVDDKVCTLDQQIYVFTSTTDSRIFFPSDFINYSQFYGYSDLIYPSLCKPQIRKSIDSWIPPHIQIGRNVKCPCCGKQMLSQSSNGYICYGCRNLGENDE